MGEQQFQQQFDQLVGQKQQEKNEELRVQFGEAYRTQYQAPDQQISDRQAETIHHQKELEYYKALADKDGTAFDRMQPFAQGQSLVPAVKSDGLSNKRKEKLKNRTKIEYEKGKQIVGEYATAQTIPLMRSLRKNGEAIRKQREKQKKDEKKQIIALSSMVIPADLFEFEITEKHSHFDVKKALKIKDALERIENYKRANEIGFFLLDGDVQARLDALLLCKPIFERALTVALAANGVSLEKEGEKLDEDKIKSARREYYGVTEAYKEKMADFQRTVNEVKGRTKALVDEKQPASAKFHARKSAIRDQILKDWEKFGDPDFSIVDESKRKPPRDFTEGSGVWYSRSIHRMVEGEDEEAKQASYRALKMSMLAGTLEQKGPQPAENLELLRQYKELITPYFNEYKQGIPGMLDFVRKASVTELISRYDEILNFEMGYQSLSDYMKVTDAEGKMLKDSLYESQFEFNNMSMSMQLISSVRKALDVILVYKRLGYGEEIPYGDLSENLKNRLYMGKGDKIVAFLKANDTTVIEGITRAQHLERVVEDGEEALNMAEGSLFDSWTEETRKLEERIRLDKKIEGSLGITDEYGETVIERQHREFMAYQTRIQEEEQEAREKEKKGKKLKKKQEKARSVEMTEIRRLYLASGLKPKYQIGTGGKDGDRLEFNEVLRELFGNPSYEEGTDIAEISERFVKFDDFRKVFKVTQVKAETGDGFVEKVEVDSDGLINLLQPVLKFDPERFLKGVDHSNFSSAEKRIAYRDEMHAQLHFLTSLTQWTDKMNLSPYIGEFILKQINMKRDMFRVVEGYVAKVGNPTVTEEMFYDREIPYLTEMIESTNHREELSSMLKSAVSEYAQEHPTVRYESARLAEYKWGGVQEGFLGATKGEVDKKSVVNIPVSEEELSKIVTGDEEFVKTMALEISSFSMVTQSGRRRVLFDDKVQNLLADGKEDLKYYAEYDRKARMLVMASSVKKEKVKEALGDDTEKVLKDCKRIMTIFSVLQRKMEDSQQDLQGMRDLWLLYSGEQVEEVKLMREAEHRRFDDMAISSKKSWHLGITGE